MKYSIVIPTYNHCDDLLKPCIESIFKYTDMSNVELVISANGCTDNTEQYLKNLVQQFMVLGFGSNIKVVWSNDPLGYPKATNLGIKASTGEKVILLNNDTIILDQPKNTWINMLEEPFLREYRCAVTGPVVQKCVEANRDFAVFFCVMIDRKMFDIVGMLNEEYGTGAGEDVEFCIEAENRGYKVIQTGEKERMTDTLYQGSFPIYHAGERTLLDKSLVQNYEDTFHDNSLRLARKYNPEYYKQSLMNNYERYMAIKGEPVNDREKSRYVWASGKTIGNTILEIGCSNGYGSQFFDDNINYLGLDYDWAIVREATREGWGENKKFVHADINTYDLGFYDTIVAMEVIEHLDNGLEVVEKLKKHCKRLLVTVPYKEPPGYWGEHHKLHMLDESHLPGFTYQYCNEHGQFFDTPDLNSPFNLMMCEYNAE